MLILNMQLITPAHQDESTAYYNWHNREVSNPNLHLQYLYIKVAAFHEGGCYRHQEHSKHPES